MIASRQIAFGRGGSRGPTAKDYVQDGLVAMWDGIENAGWGKHDDGATICKNLMGGWDATGNVIGENIFRGDGGAPGIWTGSELSVINGNFTVDFCIPQSIESTTLIFVFDDGSTLGFRYSVSGVRTGYLKFQVRYVDASGDHKSVYPMEKEGVDGVAIMYGDGKFYVFANGTYVTVYDAINPTDVKRGVMFQNTPFHGFRIYNRTLTAEEIAYNYSIDKARFGL